MSSVACPPVGGRRAAADAKAVCSSVARPPVGGRRAAADAKAVCTSGWRAVVAMG